ncbi:MAG TPA: BrnA antitoxin family protein [Candidatus Dormibacteraeota bacterium]|nr:BrnA antitoxin family protein [Candidatus Dormibacteraeota bacterium]
MSNKQYRQIPKFKDEDEEAAFWLEHDFTDYADPAKRVNLTFPNLKPSTQSVTIRLPKPLVYNIKLLANEQDVPYQSLLKTLLDEKVKEKIALKAKSVKHTV